MAFLGVFLNVNVLFTFTDVEVQEVMTSTCYQVSDEFTPLTCQLVYSSSKGPQDIGVSVNEDGSFAVKIKNKPYLCLSPPLFFFTKNVKYTSDLKQF